MDTIVGDDQVLPRTRYGPDSLPIFSFGPFRLQVSARLLQRDGVPVPLGSRAFDILAFLVSRAGQTVRHDELFARVWANSTVSPVSLRTHMAGLRKALGDGRSGARYIINIPAR